MPTPIRTGVVGTGHMGTHHVRCNAAYPDCTLAAVYDADPKAAAAAAKKYRTHAATDLEDFAARVDAATICTPTVTHFEIGKFLLERGKHLLVEKPIAPSSAEARALADLAAANNCVLQVGHIERFNPALAALEGKLNNPRFLEVTRLSPFPNRSTDIGVVLDLMIHDIEIILHLVRSPIVSMDCVGIAVLSQSEDIANVRFRFENGCVANVTASRISADQLRKIRVFQENAYLSLDYQKQDGVTFTLEDGKIVRAGVKVEKGDALERQLASFLESARTGNAPKVTGYQATAALEIALDITAQIEAADPRKGKGPSISPADAGFLNPNAA